MTQYGNKIKKKKIKLLKIRVILEDNFRDHCRRRRRHRLVMFGSVQDGLTDIQLSRGSDVQKEKTGDSQVALTEVLLSVILESYLRAIGPTTVLIICTFVLHRQGRMVYL